MAPPKRGAGHAEAQDHHRPGRRLGNRAGALLDEDLVLQGPDAAARNRQVDAVAAVHGVVVVDVADVEDWRTVQEAKAQPLAVLDAASDAVVGQEQRVEAGDAASAEVRDRDQRAREVHRRAAEGRIDREVEADGLAKGEGVEVARRCRSHLEHFVGPQTGFDPTTGGDRPVAGRVVVAGAVVDSVQELRRVGDARERER
ncbi:MAG: hypothetical protein AB202_00545 [Parcubacteria bacterium C7867-007]|nr:MAG: hypothetical protein AB202_00545 [Parcubacteria bacterium C7867-007]